MITSSDLVEVCVLVEIKCFKLGSVLLETVL